MKLTHATIDLDGRGAEYRDGADDGNEEFPGPVLILNVENFEDAQAILDTLDRSAARKRAEKPKQPAAATATPGASGVAARGQEERKPSPKCIVPGCTFDADSFAATDSDLCRDHASAGSPAEKDAWRTAQENAKKPTPAPIAAKRTKKILEDLARKPDLDGATAKTTALPAGTSPGPKAA